MITQNMFRSTLARGVLAAVLVVCVAGVATADARKKERKRDRDRVHSGYIGVYMQDLSDDVRKGLDLKVSEGVLVTGVEDDSPAAKAGLGNGDVIVGFNGEKVTTPVELRRAVRAVEPGKDAKMEVVQDGKKESITITVGERPGEQWGWFGGNAEPGFRRAFAMIGGPRLGVEAHEISDELGPYFNVKAGEGVLVLGVDEESVAASAGVKAGDVVQKIGDEKVGSVEDLRASLRDYEEGEEFTITVLRKGKSESLKATMKDSPGEYSWVFRDGRRGMERLHREMPRLRAPMRGELHDELKDELERLREELDQLKEKVDGRGD